MCQHEYHQHNGHYECCEHHQHQCCEAEHHHCEERAEGYHHCCHNDKNVPKLRIFVASVILLLAILLPLQEVLKFAVFLTAYLIAGGDVILEAFKNLFRGKVFDENFLMTIATFGAFAIKEYPEAVMVMLLYQVGEYFQHRAVEKSKTSISDLMDIRPDYANVEEDGELVRKNPQDIELNEIIIVKTGEKIPLDGVVLEGRATVDTSALTGEFAPKEWTVGDSAISGCINTNGVLKIRVQKEFANSTVSKILELVENASSKKSKAENFITKFARYYTPAVVLGAVILAVVPPFLAGGEFAVWFERALTFLVISCPCALVISIPLGFFAGIGAASRSGILIKGSCYLETLSKPFAIVFDKTGTLTKGVFKVAEIRSEVGFTESEILEYAAIAESFSSHPIAISVREAYGKSPDLARISEVVELAGMGVKVCVGGVEVLVGNRKLLNDYKIDCENSSETAVYVALGGKFAGVIVISDEIKEDAKLAVDRLKAFGVKTVMLTGDCASAAEKVCAELGIEEFYSGLLPQEKVEKLEKILAEKPSGRSVIFAGDGINDAPVLALADVGVAMGGMGSDAAIEAADAVIMDDKPSKIVAAVEISDKTMRIVKENIVFAILVKALFLILGAFGFMTMWGAVFADVGVTLLAVLNCTLRQRATSR